ncbi:hypothetical protein [Microbacterium sp. MYb66]|uniref:hypothetical protein n=1 Tax=Microbacterium sp. MYb66 TaxID=1848692 RepID=UPI000CFF0309|nr:hypothetical protein [Microbacterium sp. MYb66]PRA81992.1 hypothetical protein CQ045_04610 [Microbacterium sp. MYb66]
MSTLEGLFTNDARSSRPGPEEAQGREEHDLEQVVGARRSAAPSTRVHADTARLLALVDAAEKAPGPAPLAAGEAGRATPRRGARRIDWISVSAATLAVTVVLGTLGFAGVQMANASPAATAAQALEEDEAALASAERGMTAAVDRLSAEIASGASQSTTTRSVIQGLEESIAEPDAQAAALAAVDAYAAALAGVVLPEVPQAFAPADVDEDSLTEVAAALDEVRERSAAVDDAVIEIRALRAAVDQNATTYRQALDVFAATFAARAALEVEENSSAGQELRDAVTAAAAALTTVPLDEAAGHQALAAYQEAVLALRREGERARIEAEAQAERARNAGGRGGQGAEENVDGSTTPPDETTPTDPGTDSPQP